MSLMRMRNEKRLNAFNSFSLQLGRIHSAQCLRCSCLQERNQFLEES